jgi:NAD(P)-dependent dehydrogenase (short-subunit alcohol dehydrogenase family)
MSATYDLTGKVIVVAGASSGIGRATARAAAAAGARVVLAARTTTALDALRDQIQAAGGTASVIAADVTDRNAARHLVNETISEHGRIDALVNSVGTNIKRRALVELTEASWAEMLAVNLTAAFNLTQAVIPVLRHQGGLIIHISSVAAKRADRSGPAYQATKAGVAVLAHATMEEEREARIRVTVIYPGLTDTPLLLKRPTPPPADVLARALQPEDVAAACLFVLTLPERAYVPELILSPSQF